MSRRWAGGLVLLLALLAAVAAPRLAGTKIGGVPEIGAAVASPPAVGDCLLAAIGPATSAQNGQLSYPPVTTGPCTGQRFGEVVGVIPASKIQPGSRSTSDSSVNDPNMQTCHTTAGRYLGIPASNSQFPLGGGWVPNQASQTLAVGPSPRQKASGQHWIACIEYIDPDHKGHPHPSDYRRTAKNAYSTGLPPPAFATCLQTVDAPQPSPVNCHKPHQGELFAVAWGSSATTSTLALANACSTLISHDTGKPDVTAAGQLKVNMKAFDSAGKSIPSGTDISMYTANCLVTATAGHQLTGPLMGLGPKPLPLN